MTDDPESARPTPRFGAPALDQTRAAATALRKIAGLLLAQEYPRPSVDELLVRCAEWERDLTATAPSDVRPRIGTDAASGGRIYLDHAFDIGSYNPAFPEYEFGSIESERASGRVNFPLLYEGPPGFVHGGFLAVLADCVVQHHNCATGPAGKTRSVHLAFRRPAPILTDLTFEIERTTAARNIDSTVRLRFDDTLLCTATINAVAAAPHTLAGARSDARRPDTPN
ncbi:MAG: hypothetical protein J2P18_05790 [Nocardia sp.]|nr:hypothetical protein [Nocardia sp.]